VNLLYILSRTLTLPRLADKFSATVSSYKVDVAKQEGASRGLGVGVEDAPAVVIYKDGSKVETFKGINAETGTKIAALLGA
jgi:thioredoxin-like negative regulator of GroEL